MKPLNPTLEKIARKAGDLLKKARLEGPGWIDQKGLNDFVTETDKACENLIQAELAHDFPGIPLMSEEGAGEATGREGAFFLVDPLDGTNNFVHGIPIYCICIGFVENGRPVRGVVYDPIHEEMYSAEDGKGALLNGSPIHTSEQTSLEGAFLATGFPFKEMGRLDLYTRGFKRVVLGSGGLRRCGSAALDMCWTAAGRFDGFWELGLKPWDMAAGSAILREAGGSVTDPAGGEGFLFGGDIVAAATVALNAELRAALNGENRS
ncbi:MAG: inositol monophosphatase family protein [Acidobacteriota bacterium]|jgi:myo-inositol-1(or 4)-monophosphatase